MVDAEGLGRRIFGACRRAPAVVLLALGCHGKAQHDIAPVACTSDTDCLAEQHCEPSSPPNGPAVLLPCSYQACAVDADCASGAVCGAVQYQNNCPGLHCIPSCPGAACAPGTLCDSGHCRPVHCDEDPGAACPEHFRCDVAASASEGETSIGSTVSDPTNMWQIIQAGCVRVRCDQEGGFACRDLWECAPEIAQDPSGCIPLSCQDTGHCSVDLQYICAPTSTHSRPAEIDPHGCASRNCEEGIDCNIELKLDTTTYIEVGYCDFDGWRSNAYGCAMKNCSDGVVSCPDGKQCHPDVTGADVAGCIVPMSGLGGGMSGVAGMTGTGGMGGSSGGGHSGSGGGRSDDGVPGYCKAD